MATKAPKNNHQHRHKSSLGPVTNKGQGQVCHCKWSSHPETVTCCLLSCGETWPELTVLCKVLFLQTTISTHHLSLWSPPHSPVSNPTSPGHAGLVENRLTAHAAWWSAPTPQHNCGEQSNPGAAGPSLGQVPGVTLGQPWGSSQHQGWGQRGPEWKQRGDEVWSRGSGVPPHSHECANAGTLYTQGRDEGGTSTDITSAKQHPRKEGWRLREGRIQGKVQGAGSRFRSRCPGETSQYNIPPFFGSHCAEGHVGSVILVLPITLQTDCLEHANTCSIRAQDAWDRLGKDVPE